MLLLGVRRSVAAFLRKVQEADQSADRASALQRSFSLRRHAFDQRGIYDQQKIINYTNREERVRLLFGHNGSGGDLWYSGRGNRHFKPFARKPGNDKFGDPTNVFCFANFSARHVKSDDCRDDYSNFDDHDRGHLMACC